MATFVGGWSGGGRAFTLRPKRCRGRLAFEPGSTLVWPRDGGCTTDEGGRRWQASSIAGAPGRGSDDIGDLPRPAIEAGARHCDSNRCGRSVRLASASRNVPALGSDRGPTDCHRCRNGRARRSNPCRSSRASLACAAGKRPTWFVARPNRLQPPRDRLPRSEPDTPRPRLPRRGR